MWNSKLVILDEPTAALGVAQTEQVLALVKRLAEQGLAVVLISHNLHDVFETATRITVLRLGRNVGVYERAKSTQQEVVQAITAGIPTKVAGIAEPRRRSCREHDAEIVAPGSGSRGGRAEERGPLAAGDRQLQVRQPRVLPGRPRRDLIVASSASRRRTSSPPGTSRTSSSRWPGLTMLAFGVVFVLLLGEIDLSIAYLSGIAAVTVATMQLADGRNDPGWLAILIGLAPRGGDRRGAGVVRRQDRRSVVRRHAGRPPDLAGRHPEILELRGVIIIEDDWINDAATYYFSANVGWLIAAVITGLYALASWAARSASAARGCRSARGSRSRSSSGSRSRASAPSRSATTRRDPPPARRARRSR